MMHGFNPSQAKTELRICMLSCCITIKSQCVHGTQSIIVFPE